MNYNVYETENKYKKIKPMQKTECFFFVDVNKKKKKW